MRAKDAAGNQSGNSNSVTRTGTSHRHPPPTAPRSLAYTQPASGQIRLTWNASTDNVGVTGYDIYANGSLRASVGGTVLIYTDNQPDTATVSYYVRAKDAAGNISATATSVTRTGTGRRRHQPRDRQAHHRSTVGAHVRRRRTPTTTTSPPTGRARTAPTRAR